MFSTSFPSFRTSIETYIRENALPVDKYSHQPRLYALALQLAQSADLAYDDDILHAAVWLHDLGDLKVTGLLTLMRCQNGTMWLTPAK